MVFKATAPVWDIYCPKGSIYKISSAIFIDPSDPKDLMAKKFVRIQQVGFDADTRDIEILCINISDAAPTGSPISFQRDAAVAAAKSILTSGVCSPKLRPAVSSLNCNTLYE